MNSLALVVFLGKLLIPQEFRIHTFGTDKSSTLDLFDAIAMRLGRVVVCTRVLLL
jgi:hypothetical protein